MTWRTVTFERELRAHREWLRPWVATGHAPTFLYGDVAAKVVVTRFLPGQLVEGTPAQNDPDTYRQAGELLAAFHGQAFSFHPDWHDEFRARVLRDLDRPHRIDPEIERLLRAELSTWPGGGSRVVPTHGDWQPRNWLIDGGVVRVIDLGRADLRPPTEDFVRLAGQDFARDPELEAAFLAGYGADPVRRSNGAVTFSAKQSGPPCGPTEWVTLHSKSRDTRFCARSTPNRADRPSRPPSRIATDACAIRRRSHESVGLFPRWLSRGLRAPARL